MQILDFFANFSYRMTSWPVGLDFYKVKPFLLASFLAAKPGNHPFPLYNCFFPKIANFKRDYLDNGSDSEFTVKTKNAQFFMNFPNIYKLCEI